MNKEKVEETILKKNSHKKAYKFDDLEDFLFVKDRAGHGKGEYAKYKVYYAKSKHIEPICSLSNEGKIMVKKHESKRKI